MIAQEWLTKIRALPQNSPCKIMNVCGGHERTLSLGGVRTVLPAGIELIPGPGCPVCVCPEEDIYAAIQLALREKVVVATFGDMLRVPINAGKQTVRSLEQARAKGAKVHPISSPLEVVALTQQQPQQKIVFFAAGFETTMAPLAAMLAQGIPQNLSILLSGRLTWPAVAKLLAMENDPVLLPARKETVNPSHSRIFDALVAPGHVATVMGTGEWEFVVKQHHLPVAVAGFTVEGLLAAFYSVLRQRAEGRCFLDNCYPQVVKPAGNLTAQKCLKETMNVVDAQWRGIGCIPRSGFELKDRQIDARYQFPDYTSEGRERRGEMPAGCECAQVILGRIYPKECRLYGTACTPRHPIGPCMVSDEGACRIWWSAGLK